METKNNFLGTEKVGKLLKTFAIPCTVSLVIQALYNLVDQIFIGNCDSLGSLGNGATGIIYPLTVIALAIGLWIGDGAAANLSINQGRNNTANSNKVVGTALSIGLISSVVLMAICFIFNDGIISFFCNGEKGLLFDFSVEYSWFIIGGFVFFILSTILNPIIRADGSPKYAMLSMAVGAVINIILDPVFIFACNWGMMGAALATFLGQFVSFAVSVAYLFRTKTFKLNLKSFIPNFKMLGGSLKLGVSSFLTQISIVIISVINTKLLFAYSSAPFVSEITTAVINVAFKVFGIIVSIIVGISAGGQPILGYNYGAKKYDRVKQTFKYIMISSLIVGIVATILFEACPHIIIRIFGDGGDGVDTTAYMNFAVQTFRIYLGFILCTCITKATSIFFQAIGKAVTSTVVAMLRDLILLVPLAIILTTNFGINGLLWSAPIADVLDLIVAIVLLVVFFVKLNKMQISPSHEQTVNAQILPSTAGTIITIEREHGAGGRAIGEELAQQLNIPYYNQVITSLTAEETGLSTEFVEKYQEMLTSRYSDMFAGHEPGEQLINAQNQILNKIAQHGACVIVGRAANHVLADYKPFRVFVYADENYKINRIMQNYGDDQFKAKRNIEKSEKKRADFYESLTGKEWNNLNNYDICINGAVGVEKAVEIIKNCLKITK